MAGNYSDWISHALPEQAPRVLAWVVTLVIHILIAAYLTKALTARIETKPSEPGGRMSVEFLSLPRQLPASVPSAVAAGEKRAPPRRTPSARVARADAQPANNKSPLMPEHGTGRNLAASRQATNGKNASMPDDAWRGPPAAEQTAREAGMFKRDFTRRDSPPMQATPPRLQLAFRDTSLGGRLAAMSTRVICRELKQALATKPANAAAIIASMQAHGCHHQ